MAQRSFPYRVVDVFSTEHLLGNPVAVIFGADTLTADEMQRVANWTNLSETTFVLPPSSGASDYTLRIFTPREELPFAGHPTLGSAHALLEHRHADAGTVMLRQDCRQGVVNIEVTRRADDSTATLELPAAEFRAVPDDVLPELEAILGRSLHGLPRPAIVDVGPTWLIAQLDSASVVSDVSPDLARLAALEKRLGLTGLTVYGDHPDGDAAIEVRTFAPSTGVNEDPVCGSGNGSVAVFRRERGLIPAGGESYTATQGRAIGRDGRVRIRLDGAGRITVGGLCVTTALGSIRV